MWQVAGVGFATWGHRERSSDAFCESSFTERVVWGRARDHPGVSRNCYGRRVFNQAPREGFEPSTRRLTAGCSTAELSRNQSYFTTYKAHPWRRQGESAWVFATRIRRNRRVTRGRQRDRLTAIPPLTHFTWGTLPMPTRRTILKGVAMAAATATTGGLQQPLVGADEPKVKLKGRVNQSVAFWCFNARGEKWSAEKLVRGGEGSGVQIGRVDRPRALGHAQEARPRLRDRVERDARRAVHARVQQLEVSRRGRRTHQQDHRPVCRRKVPQCHRVRRLQVDQSRRPEVGPPSPWTTRSPTA